MSEGEEHDYGPPERGEPVPPQQQGEGGPAPEAVGPTLEELEELDRRIAHSSKLAGPTRDDASEPAPAEEEEPPPDVPPSSLV